MPLFNSSNIIIGTGSPEGVVSAPVGATYTNTNRNIGTWAGDMTWEKKTGTGNTGWVCTSGNTGWRNVGSGMINGWTASQLYMRRVNDTVEIKVEGLVATAMTSGTLYQIPAGFRPELTPLTRTLLHTIAIPVSAYRTAIDASFIISSATTSIPNLFGNVIFTTTNAWPISLPGTAVI